MQKYITVHCTPFAYKWYNIINSAKRLVVYVGYLTKSKISNIYYGSNFITGKYLEHFMEKDSVKRHLCVIDNGLTIFKTLVTDIEEQHRKNIDATLGVIPTFGPVINQLITFRYQLNDYVNNYIDTERIRDIAVTLSRLIPVLIDFCDAHLPAIELTYKYYCNRIPEQCPISRMLSQTIECMTTMLSAMQFLEIGNNIQQYTQTLYIKRIHQHILTPGNNITENIIITHYPQMDLYDIITDEDCYQNDLKLMMKRNINGVPYRYDLIASNDSSFLIRGISRDDYSRDSLVDEYVSDSEDSDN